MVATGFVAAGGRSARMGQDKAWLKLGGRAMIERVIGALKPVTSRVAIIANSPEYQRLGLEVYADEKRGVGPLEAIRVALTNSGTRGIVLVACDLPFVTGELFAHLLNSAEGYEAVVPVGPDDRLEPLCAVYTTEALSAATAMIESGERKVSPLLDRIKTRLVPFDELRHLSGSDRFFENVNTPEEYRRVLQLAPR